MLLLLAFLLCVSYGDVGMMVRCPCGRGFLGFFIDQPTHGYNGNMPSRWVRIVGARDSLLGPA